MEVFCKLAAPARKLKFR